jgi:hypothetical protein
MVNTMHHRLTKLYLPTLSTDTQSNIQRTIKDYLSNRAALLGKTSLICAKFQNSGAVKQIIVILISMLLIP